MSLCDAMNTMRLVTFTYHGYDRVVEPHTYGIDGRGHEALRGFQVRGGSESRELGWKLFHVKEMGGLSVSQDTFGGPRQGYKRGDNTFSLIRCQL